ncbi:uncharacterized protein LOC119554173 [Drosophila subpulchrella]|uniref:uncharacterized protein LOC119554173 n=1 Tax=Drosophila subpulchrella TaxID=1486046 RepID=UPI0018A179CF|nr:uncharacterized protein LOC119554173 [Drosophila subpulchrella]
MTRGVRISNDGMSRMQNEGQYSRGVLETPQKRQKSNVKSSRKPLQSLQMASRNLSTTSLKKKGILMSEEDLSALVQRDYKTEKYHTNRQTLADIILLQARRIEKQKREMQRIKVHYERQVSAIKNNASMLETHLQKLLTSVRQERAQRIDDHYQNMSSAVHKLQKCDLRLKPQSVSNTLLIKFLNSKAISHPSRSPNEKMSTYRNRL